MSRLEQFNTAALTYHFTRAGTVDPMGGRSARAIAASRPAPPDHVLTAQLGGVEVGRIDWNAHHGKVSMIKTNPDFRGKGVATALWQAAHVHAARNGVVTPKHSDIQLPSGRAWAQGMTAKSGPKPLGRKRVSRQPVTGQESMF